MQAGHQHDCKRPACRPWNSGCKWRRLSGARHAVLGAGVFHVSFSRAELFQASAYIHNQHNWLQAVWLQGVPLVFPAIGGHTAYAAVRQDGISLFWTEKAPEGCKGTGRTFVVAVAVPCRDRGRFGEDKGNGGASNGTGYQCILQYYSIGRVSRDRADAWEGTAWRGPGSA